MDEQRIITNVEIQINTDLNKYKWKWHVYISLWNFLHRRQTSPSVASVTLSIDSFSCTAPASPTGRGCLMTCWMASFFFNKAIYHMEDTEQFDWIKLIQVVLNHRFNSPGGSVNVTTAGDCGLLLQSHLFNSCYVGKLDTSTPGPTISTRNTCINT